MASGPDDSLKASFRHLKPYSDLSDKEFEAAIRNFMDYMLIAEKVAGEVVRRERREKDIKQLKEDKEQD